MPQEHEDPLIRHLHFLIRAAIRVLAVLMALVIVWGVADVIWILYQRLSEPPILLLDISDLFETFGAFLAVLIAIEIFVNIRLYLGADVLPVQLVIATALMAICRKIIVLDFEKVSADYILASAATVPGPGPDLLADLEKNLASPGACRGSLWVGQTQAHLATIEDQGLAGHLQPEGALFRNAGLDTPDEAIAQADLDLFAPIAVIPFPKRQKGGQTLASIALHRGGQGFRQVGGHLVAAIALGPQDFIQIDPGLVDTLDLVAPQLGVETQADHHQARPLGLGGDLQQQPPQLAALPEQVVGPFKPDARHAGALQNPSQGRTGGQTEAAEFSWTARIPP